MVLTKGSCSCLCQCMLDHIWGDFSPQLTPTGLKKPEPNEVKAGFSRLHFSRCHLWKQQCDSPHKPRYFLLHPLKHTPPLPPWAKTSLVLFSCPLLHRGAEPCCTNPPNPGGSPAPLPHSPKPRISPIPTALPCMVVKLWASSHRCPSPHSAFSIVMQPGWRWGDRDLTLLTRKGARGHLVNTIHSPFAVHYSLANCSHTSQMS